MMRLSMLGLIGCLAISATACGSDGAQGAQGPAGKDGTNGEAPGGAGESSISAITPNRAFTARKMQLNVSGYGTKWSETAKPVFGFGAGVVVDKVTIASPTAALVDITVSPDATTGPRDVTIDSQTYKQGFMIEAPISVTVQGSQSQGSILMVHIVNKDVANPFDTTAVSDLFSSTFTNIAITGTDIKEGTDQTTGIRSQLSNVTSNTIDAFFLIDVETAAGAKNITIASGPVGGATVEYNLPNALNITARTPDNLTLNTPVTGNVANAYETKIYKFTSAAGASLIDFTAASGNLEASPTALVLGKSGSFVEQLAGGEAGSFIKTAAESTYVVYFDASGSSSYSYSMNVKSTALSTIADSGSNDTSGAAVNATSIPVLMDNATLSSVSDQDWVKFTVAAGDIGKKIRVRTLAGDQADMAGEIFNPSMATMGESPDTRLHEDWLSSAITTAGVHYVRINGGTEFEVAQNKYRLVISIQ